MPWCYCLDPKGAAEKQAVASLCFCRGEPALAGPSGAWVWEWAMLPFHANFPLCNCSFQLAIKCHMLQDRSALPKPSLARKTDTSDCNLWSNLPGFSLCPWMRKSVQLCKMILPKRYEMLNALQKQGAITWIPLTCSSSLRICLAIGRMRKQWV